MCVPKNIQAQLVTCLSVRIVVGDKARVVEDTAHVTLVMAAKTADTKFSQVVVVGETLPDIPLTTLKYLAMFL